MKHVKATSTKASTHIAVFIKDINYFIHYSCLWPVSLWRRVQVFQILVFYSMLFIPCLLFHLFNYMLLLHVFCSMFFIPCFLFHFSYLMSSNSCFSFHVFHSMSSIPCLLFHVLYSMFSIQCYLLHVFHSMSSIPFYLFHVFNSMSSIPCLLFHVFYSMFSIPCLLFYVLYFMFSIPCHLFHVFNSMLYIPCLIFHVFYSMSYIPCFLFHVFYFMFSIPWHKFHVSSIICIDFMLTVLKWTWPTPVCGDRLGLTQWSPSISFRDVTSILYIWVIQKHPQLQKNDLKWYTDTEIRHKYQKATSFLHHSVINHKEVQKINPHTESFKQTV